MLSDGKFTAETKGLTDISRSFFISSQCPKQSPKLTPGVRYNLKVQFAPIFTPRKIKARFSVGFHYNTLYTSIMEATK